MRQIKLTELITGRKDSTVDRYLKDIYKIPTITAEEEVELAHRVKKNDRKALEKLVCANLRFVVSVAKKYQHSGLPLQDLINEGNCGLIKAAENFDETRGFKFISFAVWRIRQYIMNAIDNYGHIVRIPSNQRKALNAINTVINKFELEHGRRPNEDELADLTDISVDSLIEYETMDKKAASLDAPLSDDGGCLIDLMESKGRSTDFEMDQESLSTDIGTALSVLSGREKTVVMKLYGIGTKECSLDEIAWQMGMSKERVRQIKIKGMDKLTSNPQVLSLLSKHCS